MDRRCFLGGCLGVPALFLPAGAAGGDGLDRLGQPGVHAIMRHALAPGISDPAGFDLDDCTTQRNLDARGRAQARATGALLREAGAAFDRVLTSQWCRCRETAELLDLAPVVEEPALNSFFEARERRDEQTAAVRALLQATPPDRTLMLVTHQVNISALLGRATSSGEIHIFRLAPEPQVLGQVLVPAG